MCHDYKNKTLASLQLQGLMWCCSDKGKDSRSLCMISGKNSIPNSATSSFFLSLPCSFWLESWDENGVPLLRTQGDHENKATHETEQREGSKLGQPMTLAVLPWTWRFLRNNNFLFGTSWSRVSVVCSWNESLTDGPFYLLAACSLFSMNSLI